MTLSRSDMLVLTIDLPEHGLRRGDIGAVLELYSPDGTEVEFVTGSGPTQALVTLHQSDVRPLGAGEILTARSVAAAYVDTGAKAFLPHRQSFPHA